jgi:hypothetical protein
VLGLVANVIQLSDFVRKTLNDAHEVYTSADGTLVRNAELESVAKRLHDLASELSNQLPRKDRFGAWDGQSFYDKRVSDTDAQLFKLVAEAQTVSVQLQNFLRNLKVPQGGRWRSIRKAAESMYKKGELKDLETRLANVRQEIHTNLMVSMRYATTIERRSAAAPTEYSTGKHLKCCKRDKIGKQPGHISLSRTCWSHRRPLEIQLFPN